MATQAPEGNGAGPAGAPGTGEAEHAHRRLEVLNEISKLLAAFESAEQTFDHALGLVARTLAIRSVVVIAITGGERKMITWPSVDEGRERLNSAIAHAEDAWAYFSGTGRADLKLELQEGLTSLPASTAKDEGEDRNFVVIPLVVPRRPIFGALQFESAGPLVRTDLVFINAIANQLALAMDRDLAWRREIALRERADAGRADAETLQATAERSRSTSEALRQRYEALMDNLDHAFLWEGEMEGGVLRTSYVSARAESLLGYSRGHWLEATDFWVERVVDEDRAVLKTALVRASEGQGDQRCDFRCLTRDGRLRWFHTRIHLEAAPGHKPVLQGVSFDVTPSKEAEGRLKEQLQFTRAITSSLGEGVITVDLEDRISFINRAAEDLLAYAGEDALGRELRELVRVRAPDGHPVERPTQKVIRTGQSCTQDAHLFVRADEVSFPVRYTAAPIRREGRVTGAVLAFEDITQRKQAAEAQSLLLTASRSLGSSLQPESVLDAIARVALPRLGDFLFFDLVDAQGKLRRATSAHVDPQKKALLEQAGSVGEVLQRVATEVVESGRPTVLAAVDEGWSDGEAQAPDVRDLLRRLGAGSLMTVPVSLADRKLGALTFVFSQSARRHDERDLALAEELARRAAFALENARLYADAQQATRDREQILAIVSHDLKNPLGTVLMATGALAKLLAGEGPKKAATQKIKMIERAAARMRRLVEDLLDVASIEAGRLKVKPRRLEVEELVEETLAAFEALAQERRLRLGAELAPDVRGMTIKGDRDRLLQVLSNLVGNATQIVPPGGEVSVRVERLENEVRFAVVDNGPGMTPETRSRLFQQFWRGEEKPGYSGTGLGLSIARGIVLAHGGRIWAESELGKGATFFFTVPIKGA